MLYFAVFAVGAFVGGFLKWWVEAAPLKEHPRSLALQSSVTSATPIGGHSDTEDMLLAATMLAAGFEAWHRLPNPSVIITAESAVAESRQAIIAGVNASMCKVLERTERELVGADLLALVSERDRERTRQSYSERREPSDPDLSAYEHDGYQNTYDTGSGGEVDLIWDAPARALLPGGLMVAYARVKRGSS